MRWTSQTRATYAADWALFVDWCDATDRQPLPAEPTTVLDFLADCPAAPATHRRRVIALDHHHTTAGHPPPGADPRVRDALGRPPTDPGHAPFPLSPMSPHAVSRQARDLLDGVIAVHRDLDMVPAADDPAPAAPRQPGVATGSTKQQVRAAWDRRRSDLSDLAGIADELADVDRRAAEINQRIDQLMTMVSAP